MVKSIPRMFSALIQSQYQKRKGEKALEGSSCWYQEKKCFQEKRRPALIFTFLGQFCSCFSCCAGWTQNHWAPENGYELRSSCLSLLRTGLENVPPSLAWIRFPFMESTSAVPLFALVFKAGTNIAQINSPCSHLELRIFSPFLPFLGWCNRMSHHPWRIPFHKRFHAVCACFPLSCSQATPVSVFPLLW